MEKDDLCFNNNIKNLPAGHPAEIIRDLQFRTEIRDEDPEAVREIVFSSGFFSEEEVRIAAGLVSERLIRGEKSGYHFLFAEYGGKTIGYTCYGRIPGTACSFDLYWIAVNNDHRRIGVGRMLIEKTERLISSMGGCRVYIETSSRSMYDSTRTFYKKYDYRQEAVLQNFYTRGDDKIIFVKALS